MSLLDDERLEAFATHFYGYGNYTGKYWFVGMEEGGGDSFQEIEKRLAIWSQRGGCELEDVAEYHIALGITYPFAPTAKLQPTWSKLIRVLLSAEGYSALKEDVRAYQRHYLGRKSGESCLLELLPLPSPSTSDWLYAQYSQLKYLTDRETYRHYFMPKRIRHIKERIRQYKPKAVIFYSFSYRSYWAEIAETELQAKDYGEFYLGKDSGVVFVTMKHPAATGVTSEYFQNIGKAVANNCD